MNCFGMSPEVAHVVLGMALILIPLLVAALVVVVILDRRKFRAQDDLLARHGERLEKVEKFAAVVLEIAMKRAVRPAPSRTR